MRELANPQDLLNWYDAHARSMPWRTPPAERQRGVRPDPYHVWLSEVMLQQTTVAAVKTYFETFTRTWPTIFDLAAADDTDVMAAWAGLGYYARARNLLKCARRVVRDHDGVFPEDMDSLRLLPGIGSYTAAAIAAIAYDHPETVVDGNVERVMARLHNDPTPLPTAKKVLTAYAKSLTPKTRPGDYAQAVMDLGATICTPKNPACGLCPWRDSCSAHAAGTEKALPARAPKKPKPTRYGTVFVGRRDDGAWLLETRPGIGLLGGMQGWPGPDWAEKAPEAQPPCPGDWRALSEEVRHTFTHFHLILKIEIASLPMDTVPERGSFVPLPEFRPAGLPTVMRKVFTMAQPTLT